MPEPEDSPEKGNSKMLSCPVRERIVLESVTLTELVINENLQPQFRRKIFCSN